MTHEEAVALSRNFLELSRQFLVASKRAGEEKVEEDVFVHAQIPAIVCVAFAIELGLKAIIILEEHKKAWGHELDVLFCKLSSESKAAIESVVQVPIYPRYVPPRTFMDVLEAHSKAFEDWRYSCEGIKKLIADNDFLRNLAQQVQSVAAGMLLKAV